MTRVQSFLLIFGRVGSGWVTSLVGRVESGQESWTYVQLCLGLKPHEEKFRRKLHVDVTDLLASDCTRAALWRLHFQRADYFSQMSLALLSVFRTCSI